MNGALLEMILLPYMAESANMGNGVSWALVAEHWSSVVSEIPWFGCCFLVQRWVLVLVSLLFLPPGWIVLSGPILERVVWELIALLQMCILCD